jgi:hypothetical protein
MARRPRPLLDRRAQLNGCVFALFGRWRWFNISTRKAEAMEQSM